MADYDKQDLRQGVHNAYSQVALHPEITHPFPTGRNFAEQIGYPSQLLNAVPGNAVQSFAGVSNVSIFADIPSGATVLDLGCGTGLDSHIAASKLLGQGQVIGIDFSSAMLNQARMAALESKLENLTFIEASGEQLPLADAVVDVVLVNGIFNLNPARDMIFRELARVVRPGGYVFAAEIILREVLDDVERSNANWFS